MEAPTSPAAIRSFAAVLAARGAEQRTPTGLSASSKPRPQRTTQPLPPTESALARGLTAPEETPAARPTPGLPAQLQGFCQRASPTDVSVKVRALREERQFAAANGLLEAALLRWPKNVRFYNQLLSLHKDNPTRLSDIWRQMQRQNVAGDAVSYGAAMDAACRSKQYAEVERLSEDMLRRGAKHNAYTYAIRIRAAGQSGEWLRSLELYQQMQRSGVAANDIVVSTLVTALGNNGQAAKAKQVVDEWGKQHAKPDAVVGSALMHAYTSAEDGASKALEVYAAVQRGQAPSSAATYNQAIELHTKAGRFEAAWQAFLALRTSRHAPTTATFASLLPGLSQSHGLERAYMALGSLQECKAVLRERHYQHLLVAFGRHGDAGGATKVLTAMAAAGVACGEVTYTAAADAFYRAGKFAEGAAVLDTPNLPLGALPARAELLRKAKRYDQAAAVCRDAMARTKPSDDVFQSAWINLLYVQAHLDTETFLAMERKPPFDSSSPHHVRLVCARVYYSSRKMDKQQVEATLEAASKTVQGPAAQRDVQNALRLLRAR